MVYNYLMPTDYVKELPDFTNISHLYKQLYKRQITLKEAKEIQAIWTAEKTDANFLKSTRDERKTR